eukprot:2354408-Pyramimonas_sp.AAC.1
MAALGGGGKNAPRRLQECPKRVQEGLERPEEVLRCHTWSLVKHLLDCRPTEFVLGLSWRRHGALLGLSWGPRKGPRRAVRAPSGAQALTEMTHLVSSRTPF